MSHPVNTEPPEALAVVGMSCRFPGGIHDPASFWDFLCNGKSAITEVPEDRWDVERYYSSDPAARGKIISRHGGFLDRIEEFDAGFFSITPREAARMDPQQRWLLELAWEAIEDSTCRPQTLRGANTGVFVGLSACDYSKIQQGCEELIDGYTNSGNTLSIASNRISYQLDLKGPSMTVDTACSSSLVALNLACKHIWTGECDSALVGGAHAMLLPDSSRGFSKASMLSPTGQCFAFDARADGYVRSEGAGMVFLKPLAQAVEDGNPVYALIRSSVVNQDGKTSSMTVPGVDSQQAMLREALEMAGIEPERVSYVEAHGTGTPVGDPIEAMALGEVFSQNRSDGEECLIGSVKTNLGHLEPASGIAGFIKAALILRHGKIPPNLNFSRPNPEIPFEKWKLRVVTETTQLPIPSSGVPAVAVNSFGFGGTNAHALLEQAPLPPVTPSHHREPGVSGRLFALPVSARCDAGWKASAHQYLEWLDDSTNPTETICSNAAALQDHYDLRLVILGNNREDLRRGLRAWIDPSSPPSEFILSGRQSLRHSLRHSHESTILPVFVFSGQGAQWWAMGRQLLECEPVFTSVVEEIDSYLAPLASWSLKEELLREESDSRIHRTDLAQPALFALQVGLVELWKSWGISPSVVVGHSVGEVAAAYTAGIFSLREATGLVFHRSRLQASASDSPGRMVAVGISAEDAEQLIGDYPGKINVAAINSPSLVTLAGDRNPLEEVVGLLSEKGVFVRWLPIEYAFHTHQMDPIEGDLLKALSDLDPQSSTIPFLSTVHGEITPGEKLDANYWWQNVREPVRFADAMDVLMESDEQLFLEVGPHPALASSISDCLAGRQEAGVVLHSLRRDADNSWELAKNLAGLHVAGAEVDWSNYLQTPPDRSRLLPRYPWQRKRFWLESLSGRTNRTASFVHPLLGVRVDSPQPCWRFLLDPRSFPYLDDHRFWDQIVFPVAGFAEMGLAVGRELHRDFPITVENLVVVGILFLSRENPPTIQIEYDEEDCRFHIFSRQRDTQSWILHATGRVIVNQGERNESIELSGLRTVLPHRAAHWDYYEDYRKGGYEFGPSFRLIEQIWFGQGQSLAEVVIPDDILRNPGGYLFHPTCIDACFQTVRAASAEDLPEGSDGLLFLPSAVRQFRARVEKLPRRFWVHARVTEQSGKKITSDLWIYDRSGGLISSLHGFEVSAARRDPGQGSDEEILYTLEWAGAPHRGLEMTASEEPSSSVVGEEPETLVLLLADQCDEVAALKQDLISRGHKVSQVSTGEVFSKISSQHFSIDPSDPDQVEQACCLLEEGGESRIVVAHLWSLGHSTEDVLKEESLRTAQETGVISCLHFAQSLAARKTKARFCCLVPSLSSEDGPGIPRLASAPLTGFLRVAVSEHPELDWLMVHLDPAAHPFDAPRLADELIHSDGETEIAYLEGARYARQIRRTRWEDLPHRVNPAGGDGSFSLPYRIESENIGQLDGLVINRTFSRDLLPDEVEVRVAAAGINFRDLLKALARYPGEGEKLEQFGDDFSGTIVRAGSNVSDFLPGDEVIGMASHCFQSHVVANRHSIFPKSPSISFSEAATLPTVFLTAHYALHELARLQPGSSILIHAAAGGVGLAAVQVAQSLGLTIFATAGTDQKREMLRNLGIAEVMDSRHLGFADEILEATDGRGVDAVLNSLSGEFIHKSLSVLAPFGKFLEIGKVDIYANRKLGMEAMRNNISYFVIDMEQLMQSRPEMAVSLMGELRKKFESGEYRPLPHKVFPADQVEEAFREMARGEHVGKLVLDFSRDEIPAGMPSDPGRQFREDLTYLISGGANGFGFEVARWLAENGARHLVLLSRSGPGTQEIGSQIEKLRSAGIQIRDERVDICDEAAVAAMVERVESEMKPVGGVIHAAMVLENHFIRELDRRTFEASLHPKILGAWNLHSATLHRNLDFFVSFSSFAGVIGSFRQANYNAGNTFLDELANYRRAIGLSALSIDWGALAGAGYVERNEKTRAYLELSGVKPFEVGEALSILQRLLSRDVSQIAAAKVDWSALLHLAPAVSNGKLFRPVVEAVRQGHTSRASRRLILNAPPEKQLGLVEDFITSEIAAVFATDVSSIQRTIPVTNLGLDSLMAIELLNRIEGELGTQVPIGNILNGPTVKELAVPLLDALLASDIGGDTKPEE